MLLFKRRRREPEPIDLWGPSFNPRRVPEGPDPIELNRLVIRLQTLSEVRAPLDEIPRAMAIVASIEDLIAYVLESPTKHRDWREARPRIVALVEQLGTVLYQELPEEE
jgi:hypothetical protein